jgi:hypothetical protein
LYAEVWPVEKERVSVGILAGALFICDVFWEKINNHLATLESYSHSLSHSTFSSFLYLEYPRATLSVYAPSNAADGSTSLCHHTMFKEL